MMKLLEGLKVNKSDHDDFFLSKAYTTILRLAHRLEDENIPYDLHRCWEGWQICFEHNGHVADIVEHNSSYGSHSNLMESMDFEEDNGDVTGYLNIEEAMQRIYNFFEMEERKSNA